MEVHQGQKSPTLNDDSHFMYQSQCHIQLNRITEMNIRVSSRKLCLGRGEAAGSANCGIAATYSVDSSNSSEFRGLSESHGEK